MLGGQRSAPTHPPPPTPPPTPPTPRAPPAEKKQKKEQKEEAEKHQRLQQELDEARASYVTWQASMSRPAWRPLGSCTLSQRSTSWLQEGVWHLQTAPGGLSPTLFFLQLECVDCNCSIAARPHLQVYHIDQEISEAEGQIRELEEQLAEAERSLQVTGRRAECSAPS